MPSWANYLDPLLFAVVPYLAVFTLILATIQRYRAQSFTYSSLSSQFLENKQHFWALVPFHYGILAVVVGHVVAFLIPRQILVWNSHPLRLYVLELSALVCGLLTLIGLLAALTRRLTNSKVRLVTSPSDWAIYALLLVQVATGIAVALCYPWGSSWYATSMAPYLWSLVKLNPEIAYVAPMPLLVKAHILNAFLIVGFFPFTRLVHILVIPNPYLWRRPQVVRWYGRKSDVAK